MFLKTATTFVAAALKWRRVGEPRWHETAMSFVDNDRWRGICALNEIGVYEYTVEAWTDTFRSWRDEFTKKFEAGISALTAEALEGAALIEAAGKRAHVAEDSTRLCELSECIRTADNAQINNFVNSGELEVLMATYPDRSWATQYMPPPRVIVERKEAQIAAWYEFFPRSAEGHGDRGSTIRDCLPRVDDARAMGFNVIYFPPIHPIGHTNRKGRNNSVTAVNGRSGRAVAIGSEAGGPQGSRAGCWVRWRISIGSKVKYENAEWRLRSISRSIVRRTIPMFATIRIGFISGPTAQFKFAENPPKNKYEDIFPLNFRCEKWAELWAEMVSIVLFWAGPRCAHVPG